MLRQLYILTFVVLFGAVLYGQSKVDVSKMAPIKMDQQVTNSVVPFSTHTTNMPAGWVLVDTMGNGYGPAIGTLNPLAFDPYSGALAIVHRGGGAVGTTSGRIYYNYSTDFGATWTRTPTAVNEGNVTVLGRYPSMAIANPTQSTDINNTLAAFSWPELNPGTFGFIGFSADQPVGGGNPAPGIEQGPPAYSSQVPCFVSASTDNVFWVSDNAENAAIRLFKTADFSTVEKIDPPEWLSAIFGDGGAISLGGVSNQGTVVVGTLGTFASPVTPITSGWYVGISKSADQGATWSTYNVCDFRTVPGLTAYDRLFDAVKGDAFVTYQGDIGIDNEGKSHLVVALTDTVPSVDYPNNYGNNALVELIETATGWEGKVIYAGIDNDIFTTNYNGLTPSLGQMAQASYIAISEDGNFYLAQWCDKNATVDSLTAIYYSYRTKTTAWSPRVMLNPANTLNLDGAHLAPKIRKVADNKYQAFHGVWYQLAENTWPYADVSPAGLWVASTEITVTGTDVNDNNIATSFELGQNYPNPFNPTTNISYSLPVKGNVSIKVFDVLGNEVASLFNGIQESGSHTVSFDASSLASGMYLYTITAGNFTASKKMMLMK